MSAVPNPIFTFDEYLKFEREAEERHEYLDGHIYKMSGESLNHSRLGVSLSRIFSSQLLGKTCEVFSPNLKVLSGPSTKGQRTRKGMFSYPDLTVVCGQPLFHDEHTDVLLNPTVIIEILSPSTENFDRGEKFFRYQTHINALTDYLLITQTRPRIEHYRKQDDGGWIYFSVVDLAAEVYLASIDCSLKLVEVYDRVEFSDNEGAEL